MPVSRADRWQAPDTRILRGFGDAGVIEAVESASTGTYRAVYKCDFRRKCSCFTSSRRNRSPGSLRQRRRWTSSRRAAGWQKDSSGVRAHEDKQQAQSMPVMTRAPETSMPTLASTIPRACTSRRNSSQDRRDPPGAGIHPDQGRGNAWCAAAQTVEDPAWTVSGGFRAKTHGLSREAWARRRHRRSSASVDRRVVRHGVVTGAPNTAAVAMISADFRRGQRATIPCSKWPERLPAVKVCCSRFISSPRGQKRGARPGDLGAPAHP